MRQLLLIGAILTAAIISDAKQLLLTPENTIILRGIVSDNSMYELRKKLFAADEARKDKRQPIYLVIDSPGGSVSAGDAFIHAIAPHIENIQTVTMFAASMAAGIVQGLPGKRLIADNGTLMFHRASGGVEGQFEDGELESRLSYYKSFVRLMEQRNANRMNMTLALYKDLVKDELWMLGREAISMAGADEVVTLKCSPELIKQRTKGIMQIFVFVVEVTSSGCPVIDDVEIADNENEAAIQALNTYRSEYKTKGIFAK